jgi:hypothetical protein
MLDVNMAITKGKVTKEQVFKDKKLIKKKFVTDWKEEQKLQQSFVNIIQEMQANDPSKILIPKEKT